MGVIKRVSGGRLPQVGALQYEKNEMHFYLGQTKCEHCHQKYRISLTLSEARRFAQRIGIEKLTVKQKIAKRVEKWASSGKI